MAKTIQISVTKYGCRGLHAGFVVDAEHRRRGKNHDKNTAKKVLGSIVDPSNGQPIRTRTIARGMNHRCPCGSGKKSRNCCKVG